MSPKNKNIHLRLSEDEYQNLCKAAKISGMTLSEYIRCGIGEIREPIEVPIELKQAIREFNAVGINLNQLVLLARKHYYPEIKIEECINDINESRSAIMQIIMNILH